MLFYYKIPPKYVEEFGLANTMTRFPDGNFFVPRAVVARINPDIDKALQICGGIAITLDDARDEQLGLASHPLPGESADGEADTDDSKPLEGAPE